MKDDYWLVQRFEEHRPRLRQVAYRVLGSATEADDAVQEAWIRLSRSDIDQIDSLGGWLTTVVARVSFDMLRARASRREEPFDAGVERFDEPATPEAETILADSVGMAMLVVLDTLSPAERVAFVLHDMFAFSFQEIAPIVGRSEIATRKLASRARARVRGADPPARDESRHQEIVAAFLSAAREGNIEALLTVLDPEVVLTADQPAPRMGSKREVRGARAVATVFSGGAQAAGLALIDGAPGLIWMVGGRPRVVFDFTVFDERIKAIELIADQDQIEEMDLRLVDGRTPSDRS